MDTGIMEYREMKKLINWKGKDSWSPFWPNYRNPLCFGQRNHQELFETGEPEHVQTCNGCRQSNTVMSELLLGIRKELGAMSRQKPKMVLDR